MSPFVQTPQPRMGMMLAWYPPMEVRERLALPGGELASELHVTLLYFGKYDEIDLSRLSQLRNALSVFVETVTPMKGEIGGVGRFTASPQSEGKDPLIALISVPKLHELRVQLEKLVSTLVSMKPSPHGFIPHLTLAYLNEGQEAPIQILPRIPIVIDSLTLKVGGLAEEYALEGVSNDFL